MPTTNQAKAYQYERDLAAYFCDQGFPHARRRVVPKSEYYRCRADQGDLEGIPGFCVQAKNWPSKPWGLTGKLLRDALAETQAQCAAAGQIIPLLIEKRYWEGDIGWSHVHLPERYHIALLLCKSPEAPALKPLEHPVRAALCHLMPYIVIFSQRHGRV